MRIIPKYASGNKSVYNANREKYYNRLFTSYDTPDVGELNMPDDKDDKKTTTTSSKGSSSKKNDFGYDDILLMVNGYVKELLPNDTEKIVSKLLYVMSTDNIANMSPSLIATIYLSTLNDIGKARRSYLDFTIATEQMKANGSANDYVIDKNGLILALDVNSNDFKYMTYEDYESQKDRYSPITVSKLAELRAYDSKFIDNYLVNLMISNNVSTKLFDLFIDDLANTLGTTTTEYQGNTVVDNTQKAYAKALLTIKSISKNEDEAELLLGLVTGANKGVYKYKVVNESQETQISNLLSYMVSLLPESFKTYALMKLHSDDRLGAAEKLILKKLLSQASPKHSVNFELDATNTKALGKDAQSSLYDDDRKINESYYIARGMGGTHMNILIDPGDNKTQHDVIAYGSLLEFDPTKEHKYATMADYFHSKGSKITNNLLDGTLTVGGLPVMNPSEVVLKDYNVFVTDYPTTRTADNKEIPDFNNPIIKKKKEIDDKNNFKNNPPFNDEELAKRNKAYNEIGIVMDKDGNITSKDENWKKFAIFNVLTPEDNLIASKDLNDEDIPHHGSMGDKADELYKSLTSEKGDDIVLATAFVQLKPGVKDIENTVGEAEEDYAYDQWYLKQSAYQSMHKKKYDTNKI